MHSAWGQHRGAFALAALAVAVLLFSPGHECQTETRILGGEVTEIQDVPYHVAIYGRANGTGNYKQLCGGTLISTKLVVTAAHCVWDSQLRKVKDSALFKVAAGKTHISWETSRDTSKSLASLIKETFGEDPDTDSTGDTTDDACQKRDVAKIAVPRRYLGVTLSYAFDIAVLTLAEKVTLTDTVGVAHVDWENAWTRVQLAQGRQGTVAGWGISETGLPSEQLRSVRLPYVDADTCFDSLPLDQKRFVTQDKFCAGFVNRNISVCPGDSGGGLVFYHRESDKHYLRGVVSFAFTPAESRDKCYAQRYTAFTKIEVDALRVLIDSLTEDVSAAEECGRRGRRATPLIAGGQDANEAEFPWNVAVYESKSNQPLRFLCGGNLISFKFVVSAAFCFYDERASKVKDPSQYRISLGSIRSSYNETANLPTVQTFGVAAITLHPGYVGSKTNHDRCIAVVQLDRAASLTPTVAPVCVDWDGTYEGDLRDGVKGVVAGFGYDSSGQISDTLQWIEQPYVNLKTCVAVARVLGVEVFVFAPNFCVGEVSKSRAMCPGDSGAGFSVLHEANQRYYLRGFVSIALRPANHVGPCYTEAYTVMQTIGSPFVEWIRDVMLAAPESDPV